MAAICRGVWPARDLKFGSTLYSVNRLTIQKSNKDEKFKQFLSNLMVRFYRPSPFKKSSVIVLHCPVDQAEIVVIILSIIMAMIRIIPETRIVADSLRQFWFYLQLNLSALKNILVIITVCHIFDHVYILSELLEETSQAQEQSVICLLLVLLLAKGQKRRPRRVFVCISTDIS